eukprot:gene52-52_t
MYSGPMSELSSYFQALGYPCPTYMNPAEHVLDIVSVDYSTPDHEEESFSRILAIASKFTQSSNYHSLSQLLADKTSTTTEIASSALSKPPALSILRKAKRSLLRFRVLFQRAWRQITRDKALNIARFSSSIFSALLFGAIYFQLGKGASTVADRLGLLQVAAINTAMTALIKATTAFVSEKFIVQRERRSGSYGVGPYFIAKLLAEFPLSALFPCLTGAIIYKLCGLNPAPGRLARFLLILTVESLASTALGVAVGSLAPSVEAATAIAPAVMVIFIVFGGLYVVNAPSYLSWIPQTSLIRWAYEALCINEFSGLELVPESLVGPLSVSKGEQVLKSIGFADRTVSGALLAQLAIIATNYLFTYAVLLSSAPKSEPVQAPDDVEKEQRSGRNKPPLLSSAPSSTLAVVPASFSTQTKSRVSTSASNRGI